MSAGKQLSFAEKLMAGKLGKEEKKLIEFIKPVDPTIKSKLHMMANNGFSAEKPRLITIELIKDAINIYKQENGIFSLEITQSNCEDLALSFRKILQISNLENLVNVHTLRLDNNMIMKIENLSKLKNIKWLDLSFNYISEIEGLDDLLELTDLSLFSNQITEVKNLDKNRKLNVLSVGNNQITDCKAMAVYLRKFNNLQALCVHMNPFCKDEESIQKQLEQNSQVQRFPGSYEPLIHNLQKLKYLDWKPINEEYRESVINNYQSTGKDDLGENEEDEEKKMAERQLLHNADLDEIVDFFPRVVKNIKEDIASGVTWENLIKIPGLEDNIKLTENAINEDIENYKEIILEIQKEKDKIINQHKKELEKNEDKFIVKSKEMIRNFKRTYKQFVNDLQSGKIKDVKNVEDSEKYVGLEKLKNDLLEIEVYEKQQLIDFLKVFRKDVGDKNSIMVDKTDTLRQNLDAKKNGLKEKISQIVTELQNKIDAYTDATEKPEDAKEGEEEEVQKDEKMEELSRIFQLTDFKSDLEKITEVLDDRISKLKENLEAARTSSTENYFNMLNTNDYYRNKKRIQDIQEIYNIYWEKIKKEIDASIKPKNGENQEI